MRKESCKPRQVRPHLVDRLALAMCTARRVDGIWIGSWGRTPEEDLTRVERALLLIQQHSPLDHARVVRELERIWVDLSFHGLGEYRHSLKACILDERYVADPATTIERIASTIVHEATHARLERYGIGYKEELRTRSRRSVSAESWPLLFACPTAPNCSSRLHDTWSGIRPIRASLAMPIFERETRRVELKRCATWGSPTCSSERYSP